MKHGPAEPTELEVKLEASDELEGDLAERVVALLSGRPQTRSMRTVYWDSEDLRLWKRGVVLRLREIDGRYLQSLKIGRSAAGGRFERGEWEVPIDRPEPNLDRIESRVRVEVEDALRGRDVAPRVVTEVLRVSFEIERALARIEIAIDEGEVRADEERWPIREVELERIEGDPDELLRLAAELAEQLPLRPGTESKSDRGFRALAGVAPEALRARDLDLHGDASVDDFLAAAFEECSRQVLGNRDLAREGRDPEGVHQMRVGIRRLRAALSALRSLLPDDGMKPLRHELRWLARALGPVRDWDVFLLETLDPLVRRAPDDPGLKGLRELAGLELATAQAELREVLDSGRYGRLALQLGSAVWLRPWRKQLLDPDSARIFAPARDELGKHLDVLHRRALRAGKRIEKRSVDELHELRVRLKRVRYVCELARPLHPRGRSRKLLARCSRLQGGLGAIADAAVAEDLCRRLASHPDADVVRAAGFVTGWKANDARHRIAGIAPRWRKFAALEPYWR